MELTQKELDYIHVESQKRIKKINGFIENGTLTVFDVVGILKNKSSLELIAMMDDENDNKKRNT